MSDDPDSPSRPRRARLRVEVTGVGGRPVVAPGLARWLAAIAPPRAAGAVAVALVSDARMRSLNRRYRGADRVTDVLSFPAFAPAALRRGKPAPDPQPPASGPRFLGDIAIATGRARRQAREAGHPYGAELRLLALHGLLHLLGYDHEDGSGRMARMERTLRRRGGLETGLIERAGGSPPRRRTGLGR